MGTFLVTGAAKSGFGEAITRELLGEGHRVVGLYSAADEDDAARLRDEFTGDQLTLTAIDFTNRDELLRFTQGLELPLDGIVNGEFYFHMEDPYNFDYGEWARSVQVNLGAPNLLARELYGRLLEGGAIVTVTSTEAFMGSFGGSTYASTKAAMHNLAKSLANIFGARKIRVNCVAAGWIGGVMDTDEIFNKSRAITPLGRLGAPEEIARVVSFLLSERSAFINGSVVVADGGYSGVDTIAKFEYEASKQDNS
jgi:NAD(P)-dependent dehydrogenase (short-subunit alcohol dehydrogenase family)